MVKTPVKTATVADTQALANERASEERETVAKHWREQQEANKHMWIAYYRELANKCAGASAYYTAKAEEVQEMVIR